MVGVHRSRKNVHKEVENFVCDICEKNFLTTSLLKMHFTTVHSINIKNIKVESEQKFPRSLRRMRMLKTEIDSSLKNINIQSQKNSEEISEEERENKGKYFLFIYPFFSSQN